MRYAPAMNVPMAEADLRDALAAAKGYRDHGLVPPSTEEHAIQEARRVLAEMKSRTYIYFMDAGHGWLKVKRSELLELGIADKISTYSYQLGEWVYLEEDCDLEKFAEAKHAKGIAILFHYRHARKRSKIRSYDSFQA